MAGYGEVPRHGRKGTLWERVSPGRAVAEMRAGPHLAAGQRAYAAGTPPSTLSRLPVLLPERAGEAKCSTAWAMSSGRTFTRSVVRAR